MKTRISIYNRTFAFAYVLLAVVLLCGCQELEPPVYNTEKVCKVLKAKRVENESTNLRGDFRVVHYFLYDDGELEEVELKEYMSFNVQDTICWNVCVRVK